ncbi:MULTISPECIES: hypothetical protein [Pseudomonas]|uniref:hypothetical protein n=1 Tax=Pseudomonas TaxID=286 RepID=UPI0018E7791B|nr:MULTISPECIES: hypothetical protein [Pseudomonas]MBJ2286695.1 hypothetical protein [Pseudomonas sp. MF6755]MDH0796118.1 hypothetical protein [Pseudomonas carnis]
MDNSSQRMQFLQYHSVKLTYPEDVRRMRAVLTGAGYMAFDIDLERLWDEFSHANNHRGKWRELPEDDIVLLRILLTGFGVIEQWFPDDHDAPHDCYPSHWPSL